MPTLNVSRNDEAYQPARISALIRSAAFSPIMIVGALVLPPISVGMIDASTTRNAETPRTRSCGSTTASIVHAHPARSDGMVDRVRAIAQHGADFVVGRDAGGEHLLAAMRVEHRRLRDAARDPEALDHDVDVVGMRVEARVDQRRCQRIAACERQRSRALGPQHADVRGKPARRVQSPAVVLENADAEMELDVGRGQLGRSLEEAAGFGNVGREDAAAVAVIAHSAAEAR